MTRLPATGTSRSGIEIGRTRDARICWLLEMHPVTSSMLVSLGWFTRASKARKRLRRLVARKRVRLIGTVCRRSGRPEHVFCRWTPKADQLLHEVELTELCFRLDAGTILRGPHVTDKYVRPDAEVWINGQLYYLELDRGTMSYAQIARRYLRYKDSRHLVLWVCSSQERRDGLRRRAVSIRHIALFSTLPECLVSPHNEIWTDHFGNCATLPRESRGSSITEKTQRQHHPDRTKPRLEIVLSKIEDGRLDLT
jgi:hypothetical protein